MSEELRLAEELERGIMARVRVRVVNPWIWSDLIGHSIYGYVIKFRYADFINRIVEFDLSDPISAHVLRKGLREGHFKIESRY